MKTGFIYSLESASTAGINFLSSHNNTTGGNNLISVSIPDTYASKVYSQGITFEINTSRLTYLSGTSKTGAVDGEAYIQDKIPLVNIIKIKIPSQTAYAKLSDLPLCNFCYGSNFDYSQRIKYIPKKSREKPLKIYK